MTYYLVFVFSAECHVLLQTQNGNTDHFSGPRKTIGRVVYASLCLN